MDASGQNVFSSGEQYFSREQAERFVGEMPVLRSLLEALPQQEEGLTCFGERFPSQQAVDALWEALRALQVGDHKVSLVMVDAASHSGVSFQSSRPMCTQSTVKGVYIGSLLSQSPQVFWDCQEEIYEAIAFSSNEAYASLRQWYGAQCLEKWCLECGVSPSFSEPYYPRAYTARDMLRLWTRLYAFLNGGEDVNGVGEYFKDSLASATRSTLGDQYMVQSKAGWESGIAEGEFIGWENIPWEYRDGDPLNDETAINDTGIVYTPQGPYLFVIYTDHPFGYFSNCVVENPLYPLVRALLGVQQSLHRE